MSEPRGKGLLPVDYIKIIYTNLGTVKEQPITPSGEERGLFGLWPLRVKSLYYQS